MDTSGLSLNGGGYDGGGGGVNWGGIADLASVANQSLLQWYATTHNKPVMSGQPTSLMRNVLGTDLSGGPSVLGQTAGTLGPLVLVGIIVAGVVLVMRR